MERSNPTVGLRFTLPLAGAAVVDLAARLAVPTTVIALAYGKQTLAVVVAAAVNALAVVRGVVAGKLLQEQTMACYRELLAATARQSVVMLRARGIEQSVTMLLAATQRTASTAAATMPRLAADLVGLAVVAVGLLWFTPAKWLLLGAGAVVLVAVPVALIQGQQRRSEQTVFDQASEVVVGVEALLDGCMDLRAHARDEAMASEVAEHAGHMARAKARSATLGSLISLLPLGIALLATTPLVGWLRQEVSNMVAVGALAATALMLAIGAARAWGDILRSAPDRMAFARFVAAAKESESSVTPPLPQGWLRDATIIFDGISVVYQDRVAKPVQHSATRHESQSPRMATPHDVRHAWPPGEGLAITGSNGAGKSTLALVLLGLIEPSSGRLLAGDDELCTSELRKRVAYLPQNPFASPSQTIRWHYTALTGACDDDAAERALTTLGLGCLQDHGAVSPLDIPVAKLSGGERQRMQLARLLLDHDGATPELIVVDEPEAGLDQNGRRHLVGLLQQLAQRSRVLLIAHDDSIVPRSFTRLQVRSTHASVKAA